MFSNRPLTAEEWRIVRITLRLCLIVGIISAAISAVLIASDPRLAKTRTIGTRDNAYLSARQFVTDSLRAPATAKFPWEPTAIKFDGRTWRVAGYVDAQNGFGALIRSNWICQVEKRGDNWRCHSLIIDGQKIR